jgi:hypothetical protein
MSDKKRAKDILVEILRIAGNHVDSTRRLYKAFYFAHLYYAKNSAGYLSDWPIIRMQHGPGVGCGEELLEELMREGIVDRYPSEEDGPYPSMQYKLRDNNAHPALDLDEIDAIRVAVDFVKSKSPDQLSQLTHDRSRSWNLAKDGDELDVYIDLLTEEEFKRLTEGVGEMSSVVHEVWGAH